MHTQNRFLSSSFSNSQSFAKAKTYTHAQNYRGYAIAQGAPYALVSNGGIIMRPFRNIRITRDPHTGVEIQDRSHLHNGIDIYGITGSNFDWDDPNRGLAVYGAIKQTIPLSTITGARAYYRIDEFTGYNDRIQINGSGDATLQEVKITKEPWTRPGLNSMYGGVVGLHCVYNYNTNNGAISQFTLYLEFLHLITEDFLPKNGNKQIATLAYWNSLHRGIGYGPIVEQNDRQIVSASTFVGPNYPVIGYLGATETPHVHVQVSYINNRSFPIEGSAINLKLDPDVMIL